MPKKQYSEHERKEFIESCIRRVEEIIYFLEHDGTELSDWQSEQIESEAAPSPS